MNVRDLALEWFERVWNQKDRNAIFRLLDERGVGETEGGSITGPTQFAELIFDALQQAFSELAVHVEGTLAEGNEVVIRWTATARHTGPFMNISGTGQRISFQGMTWFRFQDGKIIQGQDRYNLHSLIECLRSGQVSPTVRILPKP